MLRGPLACQTRRRSSRIAEDPGIGDFRRKIHVIDMGIVRLRQPLQMREQLIGNKAPELLTTLGGGTGGVLCGDTGRSGFVKPPVLNDADGRQIIPGKIEARIEGVQHAVVSPHVDDIPAILIALIVRGIAGIAVDDVVALSRRPYDCRRGMDDVA